MQSLAQAAKLDYIYKNQAYIRNRMKLIIGGILLAGVGAWVFQDEVSESVAKPISQVGKEALQDKDLQEQAEKVAKTIVHTILTDHDVHQIAERFVVDLLHQDAIKTAAAELVTWVIQEDYVVEAFQRLVGTAITSEYNQDLLMKMLWDILEDEGFRKYLSECLSASSTDALQDPNLREAAWDALRNTLTPGGYGGGTSAPPKEK